MVEPYSENKRGQFHWVFAAASFFFKLDWKYYKENPLSNLSQTRKFIKKKKKKGMEEEGEKQSLKECDFFICT